MIKLFVSFITIVIAATLLFIANRGGDPPLLGLTSTPSPTPFIFQELTIPHLRTRSFTGSLLPLEFYSETTTYASYLTGYLSDDLRINALLTIPKGTPPPSGWPAVVFVHGYIPPQEYKPAISYSSYVDALSKKGIVILKIDLRGHANSQGEPGGAYYSSDYITDTLNAYSALKKSPVINPDNITLWGHSMAGNVVFRSFVAHSEIKKVVIWSGAVYTYEDMTQFRISDASYQPPPANSPVQMTRQKLFDTYGSFTSDSWFWKQVIPTNYLDGVNGSIEIHHAVNDKVVNIGYSRNLIKILEPTDIEHKLYEYPSGGHNLTGDSFTQAIQRTADFIKNN